MKTRIISFLMVSMFFITSAISAQPGNQSKDWAQKGDQQRMKQKRNAERGEMHKNFFTAEQKEMMKELHLETAKKMKPIKNELRELMAHQKTLATAEEADLKAIHKNIEKMGDAKTELAKLRSAQHQQVRSILTEEQLIKFDKRKGKMGRKGGKRSMHANKANNEHMKFRRGA